MRRRRVCTRKPPGAGGARCGGEGGDGGRRGRRWRPRRRRASGGDGAERGRTPVDWQAGAGVGRPSQEMRVSQPTPATWASIRSPHLRVDPGVEAECSPLRLREARLDFGLCAGERVWDHVRVYSRGTRLIQVMAPVLAAGGGGAGTATGSAFAVESARFELWGRAYALSAATYAALFCDSRGSETDPSTGHNVVLLCSRTAEKVTMSSSERVLTSRQRIPFAGMPLRAEPGEGEIICWSPPRTPERHVCRGRGCPK